LSQAFDFQFQFGDTLSMASIGFPLIAQFFSSSDRLASPLIPAF